MSEFEFEGFNNLERTLGRLVLIQITEQKKHRDNFLKDFQESVYYDVAKAIGIPKERAEEIRSTVYLRLLD